MKIIFIPTERDLLNQEERIIGDAIYDLRASPTDQKCIVHTAAKSLGWSQSKTLEAIHKRIEQERLQLG